MLINALHAQNFRKYQTLDIKNIPKKGVISVSGTNESGKTSIGEAICFALFGRTFYLNEESLKKIICWGNDLAEVTLHFTASDNTSYKLYRSISRNGEIKASLEKEDKESTYTPLTSQESVDKALFEILGFDYKAFASSFYYVQTDQTSPDPKSDTIKLMAGINDYAHIIDDLKSSSKSSQDKIAELSPEVETTQSSLNNIKLDEAWLAELIDAEQSVGIEQKNREQLIDVLTKNKLRYSQNLTDYFKALKKRHFFNAFGLALLPVILILFLLSLSQSFFPAFINKFSPVENIQPWLITAIIIAIIAYLLSWLIKKQANSKIRELTDQGAHFSSALHDGHLHVTTQVENLLPESVVQMLYKRNKMKKKNASLVTIPSRELFANLPQLIDDAPKYNVSPDLLSAAVLRLTNALKKQDADIIDFNTVLISEIDLEKTRADEAGELRSSLKILNNVVEKLQYNADVETLSIDMLKRAADDSILLFNESVAEISEKILPKFTEKRYSKIRIVKDLTVQVYSDEKNDYSDFDEISSGTQRQIMLALRIAMSEQLSINSGNEQQFIFLDEPFAFFDQLRTRSTLNALPKVSDVITQVWVVAQEFPTDFIADKAIDCPSDRAELST